MNLSIREAPSRSLWHPPLPPWHGQLAVVVNGWGARQLRGSRGAAATSACPWSAEGRACGALPPPRLLRCLQCHGPASFCYGHPLLHLEGEAPLRCVFGGGAWGVTDAATRVGRAVPTALRQRGRPWRPTPLAAAPRRHRCRPLCYEVRRLARRGERRVAPQRRVGGAAGTVVASPPDPPPPLWGVGRLRPARSPGGGAHTTRCGARRRAGAAPTVPFPGGNCCRRWTVTRRRADGVAPTTGCLHWVGRPLCPHFPSPVALAVVRPPAATPHHSGIPFP